MAPLRARIAELARGRGRRRGAVAPRGRDRRAGRARADQPADRRRRAHLRAHGRDPRRSRAGQAGLHPPLGDRRLGRGPEAVGSLAVRLVIARCQVDYVGRLTAHLPMAPRLLLIKADGSVSIHADDRAYKPLNWMSPPCWLEEAARRLDRAQQGRRVPGDHDRRGAARLVARAGRRPGAGQGRRRGAPPGAARRAPGDAGGGLHARAAGVHDRDRAGRPALPGFRGRLRGRRGQAPRRDRRGRAAHPLPRAMNRDPLLAPVAGVFAAQQIKPQARTLAQDRGIRCVTVDYDALRGMESDDLLLFWS